MVTEEDIKRALSAVKYPGYSRDIISFGLVKHIAAKDGAVSVSMQITGGSPDVASQIKAETEAAIKALPGVKNVHVDLIQTGATAPVAQTPFAQQNKVPRHPPYHRHRQRQRWSRQVHGVGQPRLRPGASRS
jgi:Predicted metal-sulfur cluster biosynthetic enzyme